MLSLEFLDIFEYVFSAGAAEVCYFFSGEVF